MKANYGDDPVFPDIGDWECEECGTPWVVGAEYCTRCGNRTRVPTAEHVTDRKCQPYQRCPLLDNGAYHGSCVGHEGTERTCTRQTNPCLEHGPWAPPSREQVRYPNE